MLDPSARTGGSADGSLSAGARPHPPILRPFSAHIPRAVFMGASTGGVDAIALALASLGPFSDLPVVVVLHIRAKWAPIVAREAGRAAAHACVVAHEGQALHRGTAYFAPGDRDLRVAWAGTGFSLHGEQGAPDAISPSVDALFRSAAEAFGPAALGVVLSGMGEDGLLGAEAIVRAGGSVVVQDERSSIVWGMPGAVAAAGLASAVLPPSALGATLHRHYPKLDTHR